MWHSCISVSPGLVIEIHILLLAVAIFFLIDLYNHAFRRNIKGMHTTICMLGLAFRVTFNRGLVLFVFIGNCIHGMRLSRSLTIFRYFVYMLLAGYTAFMTFSIVVSRWIYLKSYRFFTDMVLRYMWNTQNIDHIERHYDCCGVHGSIDYIITNRTWSRDACCGLPHCHDCATPFFEHLKTIEAEIARDNIALCIATIIGMIFVVIRRFSVAIDGDAYESESSDYSEEEVMPVPSMRGRKYRSSSISTRNSRASRLHETKL